MDKERLEMIKIDAFKNRNYDITKLMHGDVVWLIEQAERVEEQQKEIEKLKEVGSELNEEVFYEQMEKDKFRRMITENLKPSNVLLEKENARLREALETIADEGHAYVGEISKFCINTARQALGKEILK